MYKQNSINSSNNYPRILGFSMFEIILSIIIISIIISLLGSFTYKYYQKMQTTEYLDTTKSYALAFLKYIKDNEDNFTQNVSVIKSSDILKKQYFPAGMVIYNKYNHTPCVLVTKSNNQLEAFMYYVTNTNNQNTISNTMSYDILSQGNIEAGIYNASTKTTKGVNNVWSLDSNSSWSPENNASNFNNCDQPNFAKNSVVINLTLLAKTVELKSSNKKKLEAKNIGDPCSISEVGKFAINNNKGFDQFSDKFASVLICRRTTANYKACTNLETCYAPLSKLAITALNNSQIKTSFNCPADFPYVENSANTSIYIFDLSKQAGANIYGYQRIRTPLKNMLFAVCTFEVPAYSPTL